MLALIISLVAGMLFALGLVLSGMTNPNIVLGFLDIFGDWNYSLAFVMVGAIGVNYFLFKYLQRKKPICATDHYLPTKTEVDKKLVLGSALFGIGWGVGGICPGPGIVNLVTLNSAALIFVVSMLLGMFLYKLTEKIWS